MMGTQPRSIIANDKKKARMQTAALLMPLLQLILKKMLNSKYLAADETGIILYYVYLEKVLVVRPICVY